MTEEEEEKRRLTWRRYTEEGGLHVPATSKWKPQKAGKGEPPKERWRILLKEGNIYCVRINKINERGIGLARIMGQDILVPNTKLFEWVTIRILKVPQKPEEFFGAEVIKRK